jgi:hypothetical protein
VATSSETVALRRVGNISVSRIFGNPAEYKPGALPRIVRVTLNWGGGEVIELEPATCPDPDCQADHGYAGSLSGEDISLDVDTELTGEEAAIRLLAFAQELSAAAAR